MALTVKEKEEWKAMIEKRIDAKIERLWASQPTLKDAVERESFQSAADSLGVAAALRALDEMVEQNKQLEKAIEKQRKVILTQLGEDEESFNYNRASQIRTLIKRRQVITREEELAKHEVGRKVQGLEAEKQDLTETVWLATGTSQIKELWTKLLARLEDTATPLQENAMAIAPDNSPVHSE